MVLSRRGKTVFISLIILIGVIILLSVIYDQRALWEPEQQLITLLPESPLCYVTFKELKGLVETFNRSDLGKQVSEMPLLAEISEQRWWKMLVYQKQLWEYEMGGKLDLKTITSYFGEEALLAIYQREDEFTFLLITALGGKEKLSIEAMTATDAINPHYKRIKTDYGEFTINTITGYPLDFSYTFIGKIGILSLDPTLVTEVLDIYTTLSGEQTVQKRHGFLAGHPMRADIQEAYLQEKSTGYLNLRALASVLEEISAQALIRQIQGLFGEMAFWTFRHRYEAGVIISQHRLQRNRHTDRSNFPIGDTVASFPILPAGTALAATFQAPNQLKDLFGDIDISSLFGTDLTVMLIVPETGEASPVPSVGLLVPVKDGGTLSAVMEIVKDGKISIAGKPLVYLETQEYKGITIHPVHIRFNFLLAVTGGYAIVDDTFVLSTTLAGLKAVLDTVIGGASVLTDTNFATNTPGVQIFIQPERAVPELKRFLPLAAVLAALSGQELDAALTQHITANLFPLESLGPTSVVVNVDDQRVDVEVRIVLEE